MTHTPTQPHSDTGEEEGWQEDLHFWQQFRSENRKPMVSSPPPQTTAGLCNTYSLHERLCACARVINIAAVIFYSGSFPNYAAELTGLLFLYLELLDLGLPLLVLETH